MLYGVATKVQILAMDNNTGSPKTGLTDITPKWYGGVSIADPANPAVTEISATDFPGWYEFTISATEAQCLLGLSGGHSATAGVTIYGQPYSFVQLPNISPGAAGGLPIVGSAMTLTEAERSAVATAVEQHIISETDSNAVLQAIVDKIAAMNPDLQNLTTTAIASAVHAALVTVAGRKLNVDADGKVGANNLPIEGGTGPNTVAITVTDGTLPLSGAAVSMRSADTLETATADTNGVATFHLSNGDYDIMAQQSGYWTGSESLTVASDATKTIELTAIAFPAPDEGMCSVLIYTRDGQGQLEPGATIQLALTKGSGGHYAGYDLELFTVTSNDNGQAIAALHRGCQYRVTRGGGKPEVFTVPESDSTILN